jgi:TRAP-type C4-dicarboxylate transport system substrate-binding protein
MHFMNAKVLMPWIDMVEKKTEGKVKIKLFPGAALGKPADQYDMAVKGVADITWGICGYTPGRFPLAMVMDLPFMVPNPEIGSRVAQKLYDNGTVAHEFKDVHLLMLATPPPMDLHMSKKLVKVVEDIKGVKVRIPSPVIGKLIEKWGAAGVGMPITEAYLSLERGVVDGVIMDPLTIWGFKLNEVTKYHTRLAVSTSVLFMAMNKVTWDKLPKDVQKVFTELSGEWLSADFHGKIATGEVAGSWVKLEKEGHTVYIPPAEDLGKWYKTSEPLLDEWSKEMESKGLPGKKVFQEALNLKKQFEKK